MDFALQKEFPEGVRGKELRLVSDNGSCTTPMPTTPIHL